MIVLASTLIAALLLIPGSDNLVRGGAWTIFVRSIVHVTLYAACVVIGTLLRPRLIQRTAAGSATIGRVRPPVEDGPQNW